MNIKKFFNSTITSTVFLCMRLVVIIYRPFFKAKICILWVPGTIYIDFSGRNWVCDLRLVPYELEQQEMLKSHFMINPTLHGL